MISSISTLDSKVLTRYSQNVKGTITISGNLNEPEIGATFDITTLKCVVLTDLPKAAGTTISSPFNNYGVLGVSNYTPGSLLELSLKFKPAFFNTLRNADYKPIWYTVYTDSFVLHRGSFVLTGDPWLEGELGGSGPSVPVPDVDYELFFTDTDLTTGSSLIVNHNLGSVPSAHAVYDQNDIQVLPDSVETVDENTSVLNFVSFRPLIGTWKLSIVR